MVVCVAEKHRGPPLESAPEPNRRSELTRFILGTVRRNKQWEISE